MSKLNLTEQQKSLLQYIRDKGTPLELELGQQFLTTPMKEHQNIPITSVIKLIKNHYIVYSELAHQEHIFRYRLSDKGKAETTVPTAYKK